MAGIARQEFGEAFRIGGTADHVHGLLAIRLNVSVADAMRKWKTLSSKWIHETFAESAAFAWQEGYGAFSVSRSNVSRVIASIDNQVEHHRTRTFQEEFLEFLKRHQVEFDPRYVWD